MVNNELELLIAERTAELRKANDQLKSELAERDRVEQALRESENQFRTLAETASDVIITIDEQGRILFINRAAEKVFGYSLQEMLNEELTMLMPEYLRHLHRAGFTRYKQEGKRHVSWELTEMRGLHKSGNEIPLELSFGEFKNDKRFFTGIARDISERKRAEEAVRLSEKKFSAIFATIPDVVMIVRLRDWLVLDVNDAWTQLTGYPKSQRIGTTSETLDLLVDPEARTKLAKLLLETGEARKFEGQFRIRDGSVRYGLASAKLIELDGEQCAVVIATDITERKEAAEALRQKETTFRTLAETTPSAIVVHRLDKAEILYVNPAMEKISGYSQSELLKLTLWDLIHPDCVEVVAQRRLARLRGEAVPPRLELKLINKGGEARWVDQSIGAIEFEGAPALIVTAFDVTDRKLAEEALRRSEERYRALVENTPDIIARYDRDGRYLFVNSAIARVSPLKPEDFIGKTIRDIVFTQEQARFREEVIRKVFETGRPFETEFELQGPTGIDVYDWRVYPEFNESGKMQSVLSMNRNITERRRTEEALRRSEERYRLIVENQTEFIVKWLPDGTRTFVNESYCRYFGLAEEECIGTSFLPLVAPGFREAIRLKTASLTPAEPEYAQEYLSIVPDGQRWQHWTNRGIFDANGNLIELLSTGRDITERKAAEAALEESEAHYRALVENTPDIVARFDRHRRYMFINSAVAQVSNIKPSDFVGRTLREVGFSDEQASFREGVIRKVFETRMPFETEFEFEGPGGRRTFEWRVYPEFDESGRVQTALSINRDITERRRAEELVRESREQLRALSSHLQGVREEERTHIAREVHDELGQSLTALKIDLYALQRDLAREELRDADRLTDKITSMSNLIDTTIQAVRRIATELRPGILDDLGLVAAIEWQANDFQTRTGINCEVASKVDYVELDRERSTAAFRILQETLTNVARHASASRVGIELRQDDGSLVMEVKDNGMGITASDISGSKSLGLLGMRERAQLLGGDLTISGAAGDGTRVTVTIPL